MLSTLVSTVAWAGILFYVSIFLFLGGYLLWSKMSARIDHFLRVATPKNWLALALGVALWIWIIADLTHQF